MTDERTYKIIGAAMEVHKELGCGFLEAVYQEALEREFASQGIPFESQPTVQIAYKDKPLNKTYQPDFICFDEVILEIKALTRLTGLEESQHRVRRISTYQLSQSNRNKSWTPY